MNDDTFVPEDDDNIPENDQHDTSFDPTVFGKVRKLDKDLVRKIGSMGREEARYLVDLYYAIQANRVVTGNQISAMEKSREPHELFRFMHKEQNDLETRIKSYMDHWTEHLPIARILKNEVFGIGPVLSAGLVANFDITKAATPGAFWRFAGLDPTQIWLSKDKVDQWVEDNKKGSTPEELILKAAAHFGRQPDSLMRLASTDPKGNARKLKFEHVAAAIARRPFNASLKCLSWKISGSFVKFSNNPKCYYGNLYRQRKQMYVDQNERGEFKAAADAVLLKKRFGNKEVREIYEAGQLPKGHIDAMAKRWAVKLFLGNVHELWRVLEGLPLAPPYAIAHMGHAHYLCQPELRAIMDEEIERRKGG